MRRLILFDVDGTLIKRGDPDHLGAIDHGAHSVFPDARSATVHDVDYDGKVDRLIVAETVALAGVQVAPEDPALAPVFTIAGDYYRERWAEKPGGDEDLLPGVRVLVEALSADDSYALGVMTGGSRPIVDVKLNRLGLTEYFPVGAFGDEVPSRPDLVPVALRRAAAHFDMSFAVDHVVVIGDTPADVHCAHVHGIRCIGVATGKYSEDDLLGAHADAVLSDLSDLEAVLRVIDRMTGDRPESA